MHYLSIWMRRWILKSSTQAKRISPQGAKAPMAKKAQRRKRSAPRPPRRSAEAQIVFILCGLCGSARDILLTHTGIGHTFRARFRGSLPGWKCDTRGARDRAIGPGAGAALVPIVDPARKRALRLREELRPARPCLELDAPAVGLCLSPFGRESLGIFIEQFTGVDAVTNQCPACRIGGRTGHGRPPARIRPRGKESRKKSQGNVAQAIP
jgi:hypothetical protein